MGSGSRYRVGEWKQHLTKERGEFFYGKACLWEKSRRSRADWNAHCHIEEDVVRRAQVGGEEKGGEERI